jgi:hypothetical protein
MATDEELELGLGTPRAPPRQHQITEDEWRHLMHVLDRLDRRVGRFSLLCVQALAFAVAWLVWDVVKSEGWGQWAAAIAAIVAFFVGGMICMRELEEDDIPAWLRVRRKLGWRRWR